jgi:uncharacterized protein YcfJ
MKKVLIAMIAVLGMGTLTPAMASSVGGGALIGAGVGAVIGHQFEGRNREAVGALIGAGIGASIAHSNNVEDDNDRHTRRVVYREREVYQPRRVVYVNDRHYDNGRHRGWYKHDRCDDRFHDGHH